MKTVNGYTLAARLCEASLNGGTGLTIGELCGAFKVYWEKLSAIEKLYYKRLAVFYKTTIIWKLERLGMEPDQEDFVKAVFGPRLQEKAIIMEHLYPTATQLATKTLQELDEIYKNEVQNEKEELLIDI